MLHWSSSVGLLLASLISQACYIKERQHSGPKATPGIAETREY